MARTTLEDFTVAGVASALVGIVEETTPPAKGASEFTISEYRRAIEVQRGVRFSHRQAAYLIEGLIRDGMVQRVTRLDPANGRRIQCYIYVGEGEAVADV